MRFVSLKGLWLLSACVIAGLTVALPQGPAGKKGTATRVGVNRTIALTKPEPLLVRINGTRALTERVFPAMAKQSGMLDKSIARHEVADYSMTVLGFGGRVHTWADNIKLKPNIESNDLKITFKPAANGKAKMDGDFHFDKATLSLVFRVRSSASTPLDNFVPPQVKAAFSVSDDFTITVKGIKGNLDLTARKAGGGMEIESVDAFTLQVDSVSISDRGLLVEAANLLLGVNKLFNVQNVTNVDQAATKLVNIILDRSFDVRKQLRDEINKAIKGLSTSQFTNQTLPITAGAQMKVAAGFEDVDSAVNFLLSKWDVNLTAAPNGKVPGLSFSTPLRPVEDLTIPNSAGDVQAFVPYSLVDKGMYEALQAGLLKGIDVPSIPNVTEGFRMQLTPTSPPMSGRDPNSVRNLVIQFAARMEDATVGSINLGGNVAGVPVQRKLDITTVNATAIVRMLCHVKSDANSGIYVDVTGVLLDDLSGNLRVGTAITPLAPHKATLQNVITARVRAGLPRLTLLARTMSLVAPLSVVIGTPTLGSKYVRVPLTIQVE